MYLYGASGHAKVIIDILRANGIAVTALVDDNPNIDELCGIEVLHNRVDLSPVIISIGANHIREHIAQKLSGPFATAAHPSAIVSAQASIGQGTVVMQGAVVQSEAKIGNHCIINTSSSVDHECQIEDYVHISPGATLCGNVTVGRGSWIGAGATVIPGIQIGRWATVGAGATVVRDVPDYAVVAGVPAKIIKYNTQKKDE